MDRVIRECLLDEHNVRRVRGRAVGERVRILGKACLWNARPAGVSIDTVVVHYICAVQRTPRSPYSEEAILEIFCDLGVSSHYLVSRRGTVTRLVPEVERAWHAGGSIMPPPDNRRGVNDFSVGIELVATHSSGFTPSQYAALADLCRAVAGQAGRAVRILGHEHVAGARAVELGLRSDRKQDPGPAFDWPGLARQLGDGARAAQPGLVYTRP